MTIKEYFKKPQLIDETLDNEIYYKKYSTIMFKGNKGRYIKIMIAHPEEAIWSIGWEVKDGERENWTYRKDCTTTALTKGDIGRLLYGTLKVIQIRLAEHSTKAMKELIMKSILSADEYYDRKVKNFGKITI